MRARQTGVTFIGWIFLLIPVAIVGYAVIRLAPVYLNYMRVAKALEQTAAESKGEDQLNVVAVRKSLNKRFDIDSIEFPTVDSVNVAREGTTWVIEANYEDIVPMFGSVSLLVKFDKRAKVKGD